MKMNLLAESLMLMEQGAFGVTRKRRFSKFNDLSDDKFILHLKESEARFNHKDGDFATFVAKMFFAKK